MTAAEECGADWNQEAVDATTEYLSKDSTLSYDNLMTILLHDDGFTEEQADYGISHANE